MSVYCKNRPPRPGSLIQVKADKHKPPLPRRRDPMSGLLGPPGSPRAPRGAVLGWGSPGPPEGASMQRSTRSLGSHRRPRGAGSRLEGGKRFPGSFLLLPEPGGERRNSHPWAGSCSAAFGSAAPALCSASAPIAASHRPQQGGPTCLPGARLVWIRADRRLSGTFQGAPRTRPAPELALPVRSAHTS